MKTLFTALLFVSLAALCSAQLVTITETHQIPQIGDTIHYVDANPFGFDMNGTGTVTAKVWDNGALIPQGTTPDYTFVDPAGTPSAGMFPSATIAREITGETGHFYYVTTSTNINRIGFYSDNTMYGIYNSPATEFQFPITAGGNYNATYTGDFAPLGMGEDSVVIESGQIIVSADMQGTLTIPTGTFNDVLRLHLLESFHIKTYYYGMAISDNLVEDDYYYWFHDTILQPLMMYGTTDVDGSQQSEVLRYQPVQSGSTGTDKPSAATMDVFPNPTDGKINISDTGYLFATLFDVNGKKLEVFKPSAILDISQYPDGTYILKITGLKGSGIFKIVLER